MSSVKSAHNCLRYLIYSKKLFKLKLKKQNKIYQIRYSKKNEFNDKILKKFFKISKAKDKKRKNSNKLPFERSTCKSFLL